jgi:hypothetical protein
MEKMEKIQEKLVKLCHSSKTHKQTEVEKIKSNKHSTIAVLVIAKNSSDNSKD